MAYYFKKLKKHFNTQLQFEINPNCLPIKRLKSDSELLKLVRLKSPELPNYLNHIFPIDTFKSFMKQLFTIEIGKYFDVKFTDFKLIKRFLNLLGELDVYDEDDILFIKRFLLEGKTERFSESIDFSPDAFYKLFFNHSTKDFEANFEPVHLKFVKKFYEANKKCGLLKISIFLKSFFTFLSVSENLFNIFKFLKSVFTYFTNGNGQRKLINKEVFNFFSAQLLTPSFSSLFNEFKEDELRKEEMKYFLLSLKSIAENLRNLEPE